MSKVTRNSTSEHKVDRDWGKHSTSTYRLCVHIHTHTYTHSYTKKKLRLGMNYTYCCWSFQMFCMALTSPFLTSTQFLFWNADLPLTSISFPPCYTYSSFVYPPLQCMYFSRECYSLAIKTVPSIELVHNFIYPIILGALPAGRTDGRTDGRMDGWTDDRWTNG